MERWLRSADRRRSCHRLIIFWLSARKKSPTSAWRRSMSLTKKTLQRLKPAYRLPGEAAGVAEAAAEAAEAVEVAAAVGGGAAVAGLAAVVGLAPVVGLAAAAAVAVSRGDLAVSARRPHFSLSGAGACNGGVWLSKAQTRRPTLIRRPFVSGGYVLCGAGLLSGNSRQN
jgi:hypothetical protein